MFFKLPQSQEHKWQKRKKKKKKREIKLNTSRKNEEEWTHSNHQTQINPNSSQSSSFINATQINPNSSQLPSFINITQSPKFIKQESKPKSSTDPRETKERIFTSFSPHQDSMAFIIKTMKISPLIYSPLVEREAITTMHGQIRCKVLSRNEILRLERVTARSAAPGGEERPSLRALPSPLLSHSSSTSQSLQ